MKQSALFIATLLSALPICAQFNHFPSVDFETTTPMVHDPVMAFEDSTYHIYFTGSGIRTMTSRDMKTWVVKVRPLMTVIPQWTRDSVPGFRSDVWAPDIIKWHGRWWMAYACSTFGKNGSVIGLLSNKSLSEYSVWQDDGAIVCSRENRDNWNAIDPNFAIDSEDKPWLVFGSFWDGIQMVRLDTTMHILNGAKSQTIARRYAKDARNVPSNPTSRYAGNNALEAPFIFKHGEYYYLFVSWDYCCRGEKSTYRVAVGRSSTIDGPYIDKTGKPMTDGGGTILVEGDNKEFEALGHCAAYHINDNDIFICHGYSVAFHGAPILVKRKILWTSDEWPKLMKNEE
jgi:arabinan endo-1,5-alpha-L-arabinosidase